MKDCPRLKKDLPWGNIRKPASIAAMQTGYAPVVSEALVDSLASFLVFGAYSLFTTFSRILLFFVFGSEPFLLCGIYFWFAFRGVLFWGAGFAKVVCSMTSKTWPRPTRMSHIRVC